MTLLRSCVTIAFQLRRSFVWSNVLSIINFIILRSDQIFARVTSHSHEPSLKPIAVNLRSRARQNTNRRIPRKLLLHPSQLLSYPRGGGSGDDELSSYPYDNFTTTLPKHKIERYLISVHSVQGKRPYMEDEYFCNTAGNPFLCIMDGHGGHAVSRYLRQNLYARYLQYLREEKNCEEDYFDPFANSVMPTENSNSPIKTLLTEPTSRHALSHSHEVDTVVVQPCTMQMILNTARTYSHEVHALLQVATSQPQPCLACDSLSWTDIGFLVESSNAIESLSFKVQTESAGFESSHHYVDKDSPYSFKNKNSLMKYLDMDDDSRTRRIISIPPSVKSSIKALRNAFETVDSEVQRISHWSYQGSTAVAVLLHSVSVDDLSVSSIPTLTSTYSDLDLNTSSSLHVLHTSQQLGQPRASKTWDPIQTKSRQTHVHFLIAANVRDSRAV